METRGKIYLATQDPTATNILRGVLEPAGYRLQEPMDWEMLAEEAGIFGADAVLLGNAVPGPLADRALRRLKQDRDTAGKPVILVGQGADVEGWLRKGADDVLAGDLLPLDVLNRLRLHLEARTDVTSGGLSAVASVPASEDDRTPLPSIPAHLPSGLDDSYESDLATIIEVSEAIASSLSAEDALYVIVRRIGATIPVSRCNVTVRSVKTGEVLVVASHDDPNLRAQPLRLSRYPEIRRCLEDGELVLIEDVHADDDMREVLDFIKSVDLRSALVLPLYVREVAVGALSLTSRREIHGFTRRELLFTRAMANLAAGVLAAHDLIERVRREDVSTSGEHSRVQVDEVVLGVDEAIEGLIEELEHK